MNKNVLSYKMFSSLYNHDHPQTNHNGLLTNSPNSSSNSPTNDSFFLVLFSLRFALQLFSFSLSANCSSLYHSLLYSTLLGRRRQRGFADEQVTAVLSPKILGGVFFSFLFLTTVPATNNNNSKLTTI